MAGEIGLDDGRYLARDGELDAVLVISTIAAPKPGGRLRRKARPVDPDAITTVPLTRVIVTRTPRTAENEAAEWMVRTLAYREQLAAEVKRAVEIVNLAISAHRAASGDPLVPDISATRALAVRIGYGSGDAIADGSFSEARALPSDRREGRLEGVDPQTRVAAVLGGRERVEPGETLLLRARLDHSAGREREAALGAHTAAVALLESGHPPRAVEAAGALRDALEGLRMAAQEALNGDLSPEGTEGLSDGLEAAQELARARLGG